MNAKLILLEDEFYIIENVKEQVVEDVYYYEKDNTIPIYKFSKQSLPEGYRLNKITHSTKPLEGVKLLIKEDIEEIIHSYRVEKLAINHFENACKKVRTYDIPYYKLDS